MTLSKVVLASLLVVGSVNMAFAQGQAPAGAGGGRLAACRDDAQKFCSDKTGPDRRQCMQDNKDKFSDACKAALAAPRPAAPGGQ
jgi:hypothetical protein